MSIHRPFALAAALTLIAAAPVLAAPAVGQLAPAFTAKYGQGKTRSLAEFNGKTVSLEWTTAGCPYFQKPYRPAHTPRDAASPRGRPPQAARPTAANPPPSD